MRGFLAFWISAEILNCGVLLQPGLQRWELIEDISSPSCRDFLGMLRSCIPNRCCTWYPTTAPASLRPNSPAMSWHHPALQKSVWAERGNTDEVVYSGPRCLCQAEPHTQLGGKPSSAMPKPPGTAPGRFCPHQPPHALCHTVTLVLPESPC